MEKQTIQIGDFTLGLEEVAETLDAIRAGRIDAVVVEGSQGQEVFTFRDASHPFRLLVEAMSEGAVLTTIDGDICYQNPCFSALTGIEVAVAQGHPLSDLVTNETQRDLALLLERARTGPAARGNVDLLGAGGRSVPVQLSVNRAHLADVEVFCVVVTDLTESRRQEDLYRVARQEIEARDRLFTVAAHELRNPLSVLDLQTQLLTRLLASSSAEEPAEPLERASRIVARIGEQGKRLAVLVGKLLDVGMIGAGRLQLAREECDLADIVRAVLERARESLERTGSVLTAELRPARGAWDRVRLEQVVDNLVSNAAKYGQGRPIHVFVDGNAKVARFGVEDSGGGIPAEARERIFRPYERMAGAAGLPGLGIGLYVTAEIVKAHGGSIRVEGRPQGGSSFVVELPAHDAS